MAEPMADRVRVLFAEAVGLPPIRRAAYLDAVCAGDADLRREVEGLLEGTPSEPADSNPTIVPGADTPAVPALRPRRIANYRIVRTLASGGMGTVYEAEQDNPRRTVALKVVRHGLTAPELIRRFATEAQILALLHHPGIAQVFEAGLAGDGLPYFAMELIRGLPLDEYARLHGLTPTTRLELMARVCDAVQHAHDKGVIHRDLKPANILVDEGGQPKVLDFGVARATDADLATSAGLTQAGEVLGTPDYMSPEQVSADPAAIDHRADVYALGVILFELLAHRLPYHVKNRPLAGAARVVMVQEAARLGSIDPALRGDVETIVAKALEKEPARRYPSAADLAADIRRVLAHEPILARPPTAFYQLRKFARRNKGLVAGVTGAFVALWIGTLVSLAFAVRAGTNATVAIQKEHIATWQTYRARIAAAAAALSAHDVADAERQLDEAPARLRDWEWHHLRSRLDDSTAKLACGRDDRLFLRPTADGLRVGVLAPDHLRLSEPDGGALAEVPLKPATRYAVVGAGPRGEVRIAEVDESGVLRLRDETGRDRATVHADRGAHPAALSPDGSRLAFVRETKDGSFVDLYDAAADKRTGICAGHTNYVWCVAYSPDGARVASGGEEGKVYVWDAVTAARVAECEGHRTKVLCVAFRPDGKRLVTASSDGTVRQWDPDSGHEVGAPYRHGGEVAATAYSPDGKWIASGGTDRTVRVWRAEDHEEVAVRHGHTGAVSAVAFTPDGRRVASVSQEHGQGLGGDNTVRLWEVDPRATLPVLRGHKRYVYPVAFSPDGRRIASGGWDNTLRLWDARTGEPVSVLEHRGIVLALAFGPDGSWLVSAGDAANGVLVWDVGTARVRRTLFEPGDYVRYLAVSPDGSRVTVSFETGGRRLLSVRDAASGKELFAGEGAAFAYSPDGRWMVGRDGGGDTLLLWDARTCEVVRRFAGHDAMIWSAAFSRDSRLIASCSADRTVRLWPTDGGEGRVLRGHTDEVFAAAFHPGPGGTRLATAGRDRAVWLWDPVRGEEVARLPGHTSYVWSLAFSPDGATLASGSGDGTVRLWDTQALKVRYQARNQHP